uniref:Amine oxidase domain-containing protein n=1 Tax=Hemiselmis andersenii TaxID=464988 RepID=A0A6U4KEZ1_HEMAN
MASTRCFLAAALVLTALSLADSFAPASFTPTLAPRAHVSRNNPLSLSPRSRLAAPLRGPLPARIPALLGGMRCKAADGEEWRAEEKVIVVGGGVAGLSCAIQLSQKGIPVTVVEASDGIGGRVRSDIVDGFVLDRGFQIFLTSYPEAQRLLDYNQLSLQPFYAGALVRHNGGFHRVSDPFRHPVDSIFTLLPTHPIGSILDKILVGVLRLQSLVGPLDDLWRRPDEKIDDRLKSDVFFGQGFSEEMIDRFFRPFLGGIFFDNTLRTTARELDFTFRMLALGENCLPEKGLQAVSDYMGGLLPEGSIMLNSPVKAVSADGGGVTLASGEKLAASAVVLATEGNVARELMSTAGVRMGAEGEPKKTTCLYFSIDGDAPTDEPILYLNGDGVYDAENTCKVNNMCFPSLVAPSYAPEGKHLASVSLIGIPEGMGDEDIAQEVKKQLSGWFGEQVDQWELLKVYRIDYCQPNQEPPTDRDEEQEVAPYLFLAGDHTDSASLNGALRSGTRCAKLVSDALVPLLVGRNKRVVDAYAKEQGVDTMQTP